MAKYSSYNGVSCTNITLVNDTTKGSINTINGLEYCTSANPAMTRLYMGDHEENMSYAPTGSGDNTLEDVEEWERNAFNALGGSSLDIAQIVYGKDGSGDPLLVLKTNASTKSLFRISPSTVASEGSATRISFNTPPDRESATNIQQRRVAWGNNVWISGGDMGPDTNNFNTKYYIWRSTDGASWDGISLTASIGPVIETSGYSSIRAIATNGSGTWWFGIGSHIYGSTDDGLTWTLYHDLQAGAGRVKRIEYTNNTVVVLYRQNGGGSDEVRACSALGSASSGSANWGTPVALVGSGGEVPGHSQTMHKSNTGNMAAGNGRVIFIDTGNCLVADVSGKTITIVGARTPLSQGDASNAPGNNNVNTIATDGEGNWYVGMQGVLSDGGQIIRNTNNGLSGSWTNIADGIKSSEGTQQVESLAVDRYLPL